MSLADEYEKALSKARAAIDNGESVKCPYCGEMVDFGDVSMALEHVKKHPEAMRKAKAGIAVRSMLGTGLLHEV